MKRRINIWTNVDWIVVVIYLLFLIFGWINIYAAVYSEEHTSIIDISQRYGKQFIWILASLLIAVMIIVIDSRFYIFFSYILYAAVGILLILVLFVGKEVNNARSWFEIGGLSLQPAEFAKSVTALALARYLSKQGRNPAVFKTLLVSLLIIFAPAVFIALQPDLGTTLIFLSLVLVLFREGLSTYLFVIGILAAALFIATLLVESVYIYATLVVAGFIYHLITGRGARISIKGLAIYLITGGVLYAAFYFIVGKVPLELVFIIALVISGLLYAYYIFRHKARYALIALAFLFGSMVFTYSVDYAFNNILLPHQQTRINVVLGIDSDPTGAGYNLNQSKISIGSGGFAGKGFLQGTQTKFKFVPEQSTDFIFCTVGEEWGFLGTSFVVIMFSFFLARLISLAERQRSAFSRIYGYGVVSIFLFHFLINIGMTIGLVPVIGIPLPFFSYGGSSLWGFTILLFIFLRLDASRDEHLV
ncbi:MAG: rod shape-determining protein RodA [Bacteroidales bacterium]|nr:rod shape-determining protein RodA [Bacteroidales bacterium]